MDSKNLNNISFKDEFFYGLFIVNQIFILSELYICVGNKFLVIENGNMYILRKLLIG